MNPWLQQLELHDNDIKKRKCKTLLKQKSTSYKLDQLFFAEKDDKKKEKQKRPTFVIVLHIDMSDRCVLSLISVCMEYFPVLTPTIVSTFYRRLNWHFEYVRFLSQAIQALFFLLLQLVHENLQPVAFEWETFKKSICRILHALQSLPAERKLNQKDFFLPIVKTSLTLYDVIIDLSDVKIIISRARTYESKLHAPLVPPEHA